MSNSEFHARYEPIPERPTREEFEAALTPPLAKRAVERLLRLHSECCVVEIGAHAAGCEIDRDYIADAVEAVIESINIYHSPNGRPQCDCGMCVAWRSLKSAVEESE